MKIKAIALNTFKEAMRDRILYLLLFIALISLVFSRLLALITVGDRLKIITDVGLASLSFFGALMAILMGTGLVYKEIDKKTIYTLLSKPIHRYQFLLGKFFGLILTLFVMLFLMSVIFIIILLLHSGKIQWGMLLAFAFIFLEMCLITSVAMLFSCFSTPILSSIFSLSFYLIGHVSWGMETLINKMPAGYRKNLVKGTLSFYSRSGELQLQDRDRTRASYPTLNIPVRDRLWHHVHCLCSDLWPSWYSDAGILSRP